MGILIHDNKKITRLILFFCGLLILAYTVIRASLLSITSDESHTFIEFVNKGIIFLSTYDRASANDHFLNTWLMEITTYIFGINELSLRLPNLLAHFLFLLFSARLLLKFQSPILIICSFLILNLNPFLLDFFMLARGYGIAIGLMMISLFYSYLFTVEKQPYIYAFISIFVSALAVLASFTLIGYLLVNASILILFNLHRIIIKEKKNKTKFMTSIIIQSVVLLSPLSVLLFALPVILNMNHSTALFWGGETGFWKDSVFSLITGLTYDHPFMRHLRNGIQIGVIIVLITSIIMIFAGYRKTKSTERYSFMSSLFVILFICFLMNFFEYQVLGILYLQERTALFYFPLFILLMAFLFDDLIRQRSKLFTGIIVGIAVLFLCNFIVNINFHYVKSWKKEADTKDLIEYITQNKSALCNGEKRVSLSVFKWCWLYDNDIYYYKQRNHLDWLNFTGYYYYKDATDFVFLDKRDVDSLYNPSLRFAKDFPCSDMKLYVKMGK